MGGWDGIFGNLTLCIGVGTSRNANDDCLLCVGDAFIWTVRALTKLGEDRKKQLRFLLQIVHMFYVPLMGNDAIINGVPLAQHPGPLNTAT